MKKSVIITLVSAISLSFAGIASAETQPDLLISDGKGEPKGGDIYGGPRGQSIRVSTIGSRPVSFHVGLQNDGDEADRIGVRGSGRDRKFLVRYTSGGENVTGQVVRGLRLGLEPDEAARIKATVKATRATKGRNARKAFRFSAISGKDRSKRDSALAFVLKRKSPGRN